MKEILKKVRRLEIKTRKKVENTFAGEYHSAFKGQGLEFDEVRLYQYGDDIRSIDWNVTARNGQVFVKKFKEEREQTLFVLFDISGSEDFGIEQENKRLVGTEIAAILAFSALKNNDKIGMATFSEQIDRYFKPEKGRKHILAIVRELLTQSENNKKTDIAAALDFIRKTLKRKTILLIISDFLAEGFEKPLIHLSKKHEVILIRLFNPEEILHAGAGMVPVRDIESGTTRWINPGSMQLQKKLKAYFDKKDQLLTDLAKKYRMGYLSVNTQQDYLPVLDTYFKKRNANRGR